MQRQAGIYVRISSDRDDNRLGVTRQRIDCEAKAKSLGWHVAEVFSDNDVSASTGRRRPAYEQMLQAIRDGRITAVVVWDLDRLTRRPVEVEQFIDLADQYGVALASVGGDADLSTDGGRLFARIKGAVARAEVDQKSRRQKRANQQRREMGKPHLARRGYGYAADGTTVVEAEAAWIRWAAAEVLSGRSMIAVAKDLNARGASTAEGFTWTGGALRRTLERPRLAGLVPFGGEATGAVGSWPPIIDVETHYSLRAIFRDPARQRPGRPRAHLLSGIASCGKCGGKLSGEFSAKDGYAILNCMDGRGHLRRRAADVEGFVVDILLERLSRADAVDLFTGPDRADEARGLQAEERALRDRKSGLAEAFAAGEIDRAQMSTGTARLNASLAAVGTELAALARQPDLGELVTAADAAAVWAGMPLDRRRAVLRALFASIVVQPAGRGARRFDPATVAITWN